MLTIDKIQGFEGYKLKDNGTTYIAFAMKEGDDIWSYIMTEEELKRIWDDIMVSPSWKDFKLNNPNNLAVWREPYKSTLVKFVEHHTLPILQEKGNISEQKAEEMFNKLPLRKFDWVFIETSTGISLKIFHSYIVVNGQLFYKVFDYISDGLNPKFWDGWYTLTSVAQPFVVKAKDAVIPSSIEALRKELIENYIKDMNTWSPEGMGCKIQNLKLDNGKVSNRLFGKYLPNLVMISNKELSPYWKGDLALPFDEMIEIIKSLAILIDGVPTIIKGQFHEDEKGTKVFDTTKRGHIFITVAWGGLYTKNQGIDKSSIKNHLYYRRTSANGMEEGWDYLIISEGSNLWLYGETGKMGDL